MALCIPIISGKLVSGHNAQAVFFFCPSPVLRLKMFKNVFITLLVC